MKKFDFLICYDISCKKRLPKIAKVLEKTSIRIQKSIFFYPDVTRDEIRKLIDKLEKIINEKEDDIRVYRVDINQSINLMDAVDLKKPNII